MREFVVTYNLKVMGGYSPKEEVFSPVIPANFVKYDTEPPFRVHLDEQAAEAAAREHLARAIEGKGKWVSYEHESDEPRLYVREVSEWEALGDEASSSAISTRSPFGI